VAGDVADRARPVRSFDRVDAELQELPAVEDLRIDDALDEIGPGGFLRGR
jgi:hypothetical protein